jgi:FKBP-type peptidyl-prolyl cis-trans isomerase SlyD
MQIAEDTIVSIDYTLTNPEGDTIDSSEDGPLVYLHGHGNIVPGLERALAGKKAGDALKVVVAPEDGYGERAGGKPIRIPRKELPPDLEPEEGMGLNAVGNDGREVTLFVVGTTKTEVLLSLDHPLAGVTLHFDVKVREVRAATEEELAHGHAHGDGDHHHHGHDHDHDHGHDHGHGHGHGGHNHN